MARETRCLECHRIEARGAQLRGFQVGRAQLGRREATLAELCDGEAASQQLLGGETTLLERACVVVTFLEVAHRASSLAELLGALIACVLEVLRRKADGDELARLKVGGMQFDHGEPCLLELLESVACLLHLYE